MQSWAPAPDMLSRLAAMCNFQTASHFGSLHMFPQQEFAPSWSPITSKFLLCCHIVFLWTLGLKLFNKKKTGSTRYICDDSRFTRKIAGVALLQIQYWHNENLLTRQKQVYMCAEVYSQRRVDAEVYKNIDACPALELPSTGSDEEQQSKTFLFLFLFLFAGTLQRTLAGRSATCVTWTPTGRAATSATPAPSPENHGEVRFTVN